MDIKLKRTLGKRNKSGKHQHENTWQDRMDSYYDVSYGLIFTMAVMVIVGKSLHATQSLHFIIYMSFNRLNSSMD